jgi:uncharacterized protein YegP (UPF0339 family)
MPKKDSVKKKKNPRPCHWARYRFEVVKSPRAGKQKFHWRAVACNGRIVCDSEMYLAERGPRKTIENFIAAVKAGDFKVTEELVQDKE